MSSSTEDLLMEGLKRERWIVDTTDEMSRRVGINLYTGRRILSIARVTCKRRGVPLDMVLVACAIKYAGDNKEFLL